MEVSGQLFDRIRDGTKKVEGRKDSPTWSKIQEGSLLYITRTENIYEGFLARVTRVTLYKGTDPLLAYLSGEGVVNVLPGVADTISRGILFYTPLLGGIDEIEKYGMKAIQLEIMAGQC